RRARPPGGACGTAGGAVPDGMGRLDAGLRPIGGRVRPQAAGQARERAAGVGVHPYALRIRLPVPAGTFTAFSQGGDDSVTGLRSCRCEPRAATTTEKDGFDDYQATTAGARLGGVAGVRRRRVR